MGVRSEGRWRAWVVSALAVGALAGIGGCGGGAGQARISRAPYEGPAIEMSEASGKHTLVITAATGGWAFRVDQTRVRMEDTAVFASIVKPDPAYMQAQALVRHEVSTGVPVDRAVAIYARVMAHDATGGAYARVAGSK